MKRKKDTLRIAAEQAEQDRLEKMEALRVKMNTKEKHRENLLV